MENKKNNKSIQVLIILLVIVLVAVVAIDLIANYVPLKEIFSNTVNYTSSKEVTVTDKGIADAVDKLYNATVIVKIEANGKTTGWGSGVVYKKDKKYGYILTNHHVVEKANSIKIGFPDESEVDGEVIGSDEYADVALVRIPVNSVLEVAEIGKSEDVRAGDTVFAIGTPVGLEYSFTVTRGILSGKNRMVEMSSSSGNNFFNQTSDSWVMKLLQIDASINQGNSGGPLANSNGEVIGITNSKLSSSYSSASIENMGFAIPIEDAVSVAEKISENNGKVKYPVLGVKTYTVEGAKYNKLPIDDDVTYGAVIAEVISGSAAAKGGLKENDVIISIEDKKVENTLYLKYYLNRYSVGDKVTLTVIRDGKEKKISVTLKD